MHKLAQKLVKLNTNSSLIINQCPQLVYVGDPVLRKIAKHGSFKAALATSKELTDTLLAYRKLTGLGRGLAAPQIGKNEAVFITYVADQIEIYINPQITTKSPATNVYKECCMSSNHFWCDVRRAQAVTLSFIDENNKQITKQYDGFMARLVQHEMDHLLGFLNLDKAIPGTIDYCFGDPLQETLRSE